MKKFFIAIALTLMLTATAAQAAVFTFDNLPAGTNIADFSITGSDVSAHFTDFTNEYNGTIYDYFLVPNVGATIEFDVTAYVSEIISADWGSEQPFTGTAWLGSTSYTFSSFSEILNQWWDKIEINGTFGVSKIVASATPLPGAALLLGTGLVGLVGLRKRLQQ